MRYQLFVECMPTEELTPLEKVAACAPQPEPHSRAFLPTRLLTVHLASVFTPKVLLRRTPDLTRNLTWDLTRTHALRRFQSRNPAIPRAIPQSHAQSHVIPGARQPHAVARPQHGATEGNAAQRLLAALRSRTPRDDANGRHTSSTSNANASATRVWRRSPTPPRAARSRTWRAWA